VKNRFQAFAFKRNLYRYIAGYTTTGKVVMDPRMIAKSYISSWFTLDVIASIPFDILATSNQGSQGGAVQLDP
jgi:hypothetical protein